VADILIQKGNANVSINIENSVYGCYRLTYHFCSHLIQVIIDLFFSNLPIKVSFQW